MKHKIQVKAPVEKRGLHGIRKTVMETGTIENDGKTCKKLIFVVLWIVHSVIPVWYCSHELSPSCSHELSRHCSVCCPCQCVTKPSKRIESIRVVYYCPGLSNIVLLIVEFCRRP